MKKIFQILTTAATLTACTNILAGANADWMAQIPDNRAFNQLIIPGTHESGTSDINDNSYFSYSDQKTLPTWLQLIANFVPHSALRSIVAGWTKTQPYSIAQQLNSGIRYFDFQVCHAQVPGVADDFFLCHSLISGTLGDALNNIVTFTSDHPSEIVIINISHIHGIKDVFAETNLINLLNATLFNSDIPNTLSPNATIGALRKTNRHIIIMMDPPAYGVNDPDHRLDDFLKTYLWRESNIDAPNPNANDITTLKKILDTATAYRAATQDKSNQFFALQVAQTPSTTDIINGILNKNQYPNTIQTYAEPVNTQLGNWLNAYAHQYHESGLNIVIQDWFTDSSPLVSFAIQNDSLPNTALKANAQKQTVLEQKIAQLKKIYTQKTQ